MREFAPTRHAVHVLPEGELDRKLAHRHPPTQDLFTAAMPVMRALATKTHQSCQVGMHHEGDVLIMAQVDAPGLIGIAMRVGARRELTNSASGLSLLAFQEPKLREEWLRAAGTNRWSSARKRARNATLAPRPKSSQVLPLRRDTLRCESLPIPQPRYDRDSLSPAEAAASAAYPDTGRYASERP